MPIYDLQCTRCAAITYDFMNQSYLSPLPKCQCGGDQEKLWSTAIGHKPFVAFDFHHNGETHHIDSLGTMRKLERDSQKAYEQGKGAPLIFRHFTQDRSNRDVNVFGRIPEDAIVKKSDKVKVGRGKIE